jgi:hypothetical protein
VCISAGGTSEADRQVLLNYMASLTKQGQPWTSRPLCSTQGHPTALQPEVAGLATPGAGHFLGPPASQLPTRVLGDWRSIGNPNFNGLRPQSRCVQHSALPAQGAAPVTAVPKSLTVMYAVLTWH